MVEKIDDNHTIFVLTARGEDHDEINDNPAVTVLRVIPELHHPPLFIRTAIPSLVSLIISLYLILFEDIDLVHSHSTSNAVPGLAVATVLLDVPLVYDCRDEDFPLWMVTLGNVEHWLSCSSNIDARLEKAGVDANKITRIPVVNPDYVSDCAIESENDEFTIIFVGTVIQHKGIFLLLDAFEEFYTKHRSGKLVIIGDGPDFNEVKDHIEGIEYGDKIELKGSVSHRTALTEISQADTLVLPSEREGMPRVIVEAFELGVPVISTPVGGIPDIIKDEKTGLLVDHNASKIADALEKLYSSEGFREKLSTNAENQIADWDWDTVTGRIYDQYQSAVS
ncbi:hypothetical protein BV210_05800 [Halorientalis sp. IM1011]|nr:hypothetical protein BV210_05800 [Halorientalis sp. IM1011]